MIASTLSLCAGVCSRERPRPATKVVTITVTAKRGRTAERSPRFAVNKVLIAKSPAAGLETPKKERTGKTFLRVDEYTRLLSLAGTDARDYAIFQVFLQTGLRVSEPCALNMQDVDFEGHTVTVRSGKGQQARTIDLETKAARAIKRYEDVRPDSLSDRLFLNRYGELI